MRSKVLVRIDRLLVKPVPVAVKMMPDAEMEPLYDGAKKMILVDDVDNRQFLCELVESMWEELPKKKEKNAAAKAGGMSVWYVQCPLCSWCRTSWNRLCRGLPQMHR